MLFGSPPDKRESSVQRGDRLLAVPGCSRPFLAALLQICSKSRVTVGVSYRPAGRNNPADHGRPAPRPDILYYGARASTGNLEGHAVVAGDSDPMRLKVLERTAPLALGQRQAYRSY